jgi:hypothetical protein
LKPRTLYGLTLVLTALLIISVVSGIYYYYEYGQATQSKNQYVSELVTATSQYDKLASNYNSALSLDNKTLGLLVGTIAVVNTSLPIYEQASGELSHLWSQYLSLKPARSSLYSADILVDFGNGTRHWYNNTQVQPGWSLFTATVVLTNGDLQAPLYYVTGSGWEHFVSEIEGVANSNSNNEYWWVWTYDRTGGWTTASVGADLLPVYNGSVFAWTYCGTSPSYSPTCTP